MPPSPQWSFVKIITFCGTIFFVCNAQSLKLSVEKITVFVNTIPFISFDSGQSQGPKDADVHPTYIKLPPSL